VVYQKYSFVYRINGDAIEILTIYRGNRPWTPNPLFPKSGVFARLYAMTA
jgi:hypothetical protein